MLSIVLYGRNDNYGYNLHKRAALSLNCMAEVLTDAADEILFVDYNTPDDYPTFPEAIRDTLTKRAREVLRILRVRPRIHERFKSKTRLMALEPIARNIAVRRSSPSNRWILSTNTDMIFVPQRAASLSEIARKLTPGFYHAPRIELPEALWESFDRQAPTKTINTVREWGTALHLNEIVLGSNFIRYDGPGDFQLLLRSDLFENHGFDEEMLLGWHVDSNIAARMLLKYETVGDVGQSVYGYHCDHTRQVTPAHSHERVQNDWIRFVTRVESTSLPHQAETWGCANDLIEEVRLSVDPARVYVQALREVIGDPLTAPNIVKYTGETYNAVDYDPRHLMPFLADMFVSMPRTFNVGWYGTREETLRLFVGIWERLGFSGKILLDQPLIQEDQAKPIRHISTPEVLAEADVFVVDFGGIKPSLNRSGTIDVAGGEVRRSFRLTVREERRRLSIGAGARRIIALNAINNEYETFVCAFVAAAATPFATHMRHGFVLPPSTGWGDVLPLLALGEAGVRVDGVIKNDQTRLGWVAYGPFKYLEEGRYLVSITIEASAEELNRPKSEPCILIDVVAGPELLGAHLIRLGECSGTDHRFTFDVSQSVADGIGAIETRISVLSPIAVAVRRLTVELASSSIGLGAGVPAAFTINDLFRFDNWLPFLRITPLGHSDGSGVSVDSDTPTFVVHGPNWTLPAGRYEMIARFERNHNDGTPGNLIKADVAVGGNSVVAGIFHISELPYHEKSGASMLRLSFELEAQLSALRQIETRIWSSGEQQLKILSLSVKTLERQKQDILFPSLLIGDSGDRAGGVILNFERRIGFVGYEQTISLIPGAYRLTLQVTIQMKDRTSVEREATCLVVVVKQASNILATTSIKSGADRRESQELTFEVAPDPSGASRVEFLTRVAAGVEVILHSVTVEPVKEEFQQTDRAIFEIENWLPFLTTNPRASWEGESLIVREGPAHYAAYGPYWTLPPGQYEVIMSAVPPAPTTDGNPVITLDVTTDVGEQTLAAGHRHFGHIQHSDPATAIELRLPFALAAGATPDFRIVETRIHTTGQAGFLVRSVRMQSRSGDPGGDWFPYLAVEDCGILTGDEIRTIPGKSGYVARTPPMPMTLGRYRATVKLTATGADEAGIELEAWSGADFLAVASRDAGEDLILEFDAGVETVRKGIDLRIRTAANGGEAMRGLVVERISGPAIDKLPAILRLVNWLPFLSVGPAGRRAGRDVIAQSNGFVLYGPYWRLPQGQYELSMSIKRTELGAATKPAEENGKTMGRRMRERLILVGTGVTCDGDPVAATDRIIFGSASGGLTSIRLLFEITATESVVETRILSRGGHPFVVCSLYVRPKPPIEWFVRATASKIAERLRRQFHRIVIRVGKKLS